jgi:hypothetical protein
VLVAAGHRLIQVGLFMLATATIGVVLLVFDVVGAPAMPAMTFAAAILLALWLIVPLWIRRRIRALTDRRPRPADPSEYQPAAVARPATQHAPTKAGGG